MIQPQLSTFKAYNFGGQLQMQFSAHILETLSEKINRAEKKYRLLYFDYYVKQFCQNMDFLGSDLHLKECMKYELKSQTAECDKDCSGFFSVLGIFSLLTFFSPNIWQFLQFSDYFLERHLQHYIYRVYSDIALLLLQFIF